MPPRRAPGAGGWTFLSNHAHVLACVARDPETRVREIAARVGITERAVMRILGDLDDAGVLTRTRTGRRTHYRIHGGVPLRHPVEAHHTVGELLSLLGAEAPINGKDPAPPAADAGPSPGGVDDS